MCILLWLTRYACTFSRSHYNNFIGLLSWYTYHIRFYCIYTLHACIWIMLVSTRNKCSIWSEERLRIAYIVWIPPFKFMVNITIISITTVSHFGKIAFFVKSQIVSFNLVLFLSQFVNFSLFGTISYLMEQFYTFWKIFIPFGTILFLLK